MSIAAIVLAAGKGTRMKSVHPKVMHKITGKPMIAHALTALVPLSPQRVVVVKAPQMEVVEEAAKAEFPSVQFAVQAEQKGTGHAVACALEALEGFEGDVLVTYGDTPLVTAESLQAVIDARRTHKAAISLLAMHPENPTGYGRLVMKKPPFVERIVECKDACDKEKQIRWVWGGVMAFDSAFLKSALPKLTPSPVTGEYYLTELIGMAAKEKKATVMAEMSEEEAMGVNDRAQLAQAEAVMQKRLRLRFMLSGVTLIDPETVYFSADTQLAPDVVVHPHVVFGPNVKVGAHSEIRAFSHIEGASLGERVTVGPFARIRPGSKVEEGAHIGNFVELKKTHLAKGAKVNHLSYVGDATVGANANIGAGTITCNYDGFRKFETIIGEGAFIGSNTSLVAPVTIGAGAITGAGSVITEDVPDDALAVERSTQMTREDGAKRIRIKRSLNKLTD